MGIGAALLAAKRWKLISTFTFQLESAEIWFCWTTSTADIYEMIFLGWLLKIFYWIERSAVSHEILKGFLAIRVFTDFWEMKLQVNIRKFGLNWRQSNYKKRQPKKIFTKKKTLDSPLSSSSNRQLQSTQSITQNRKINPLKKLNNQHLDYKIVQ